MNSIGGYGGFWTILVSPITRNTWRGNPCHINYTYHMKHLHEVLKHLCGFENMETKWLLVFWFFLGLLFGSQLIHSSVTHDRKAIIINGQRRILFSGSIHYPRSTPDVCVKLNHQSDFLIFFPFLHQNLSFKFLYLFLFWMFFRCGKIWFWRQNMEGLMWWTPTSSGMFTSLFLAVYLFIKLRVN